MTACEGLFSKLYVYIEKKNLQGFKFIKYRFFSNGRTIGDLINYLKINIILLPITLLLNYQMMTNG